MFHKIQLWLIYSRMGLAEVDVAQELVPAQRALWLLPNDFAPH
jgi:hypothetical protein